MSDVLVPTQDPGDIPWSRDGKLNSTAELTEETKAEVDRRAKLLDKELIEEQRAKFKLEVLFGKDYSSFKPSAGAISFWANGRQFHGGGDCKMYICPGKNLGRSDCQHFIPDSSQGYGFLVCPKCLTLWQPDQVIGEVLARLSIQSWANVLLKFFLRLEMNADIYVKYHPESLRNAALVEQEQDKGGELLGNARRKRVPFIYPLRNIIKDTSAGASLHGRILAFLKA